MRTEIGRKADTQTGEGVELEALRARVATLEAENVELAARANAAVAEAQDRVYWLDRWHLDLNALMRKPGASEFRAGLRLVRGLQRVVTKVRRRLRSR